MAMIQDMSLINTTLLQQATAATKQPFDDVQERINTYLGLAMEAAQSAGDDPLTGILGTAVSALAGGAVSGMFATPATAPPVQSQRVLGGGMGVGGGMSGGTMQPTSGIMQQTVGQDPAMSPWFSAGPYSTQTGGW